MSRARLAALAGLRTQRSPLVIVVGSLMIDLVMQAPRRPEPGETLFGTDFRIFLGGKGFNQAVAARRMGAEVRIIGRVGRDSFGRQLRAALRREGVEARGVRSDAETGTGVAAPLIDAAGQNSIVSVPRANMCLTPADVERTRCLFAGAHVLLLQMEVPVDASLAAARLARKAGARVVLNVAPAGDVPGELLDAADLIVANEVEAETLTGVPVSDVESGLRAAEQLCGGGRRSAVVTLGGRGAVLDEGRRRMHLPAHAVEVRDTTGAGDAFCGTLAVRLAETGDLRDALAWGNAAGACAVTILGAEPSLPHRAAVATLIATMSVHIMR